VTARCALALAALSVAQAATAPAQTLTVSALLQSSEHRVDVGFGVERSSGLLGGARIGATLGPRVHVGLTALGGRLTRDSSNAEDRDVAEVSADAGYRALPWLTFITGVRARTYTAPIARQRWTALHVGAEARVGLLDGHLDGVGQFLLQPLVSVSELDQPELAFTAAAGMDYHLGRLTVGVRYALERYDFPPRDGMTRREQLSTVGLQATLQLAHF